jgi:sugar phosphate isomerase/epimerase
MRLGVVGMLPADFRDIDGDHLEAIAGLRLTGAGFHSPGELLARVKTSQCDQVAAEFARAGVDLVQFGIGFSECLFDPEEDVRERVLDKIHRGLEVGRDLGAHVVLIRTGSLNPSGSYSPCRDNYRPESRQRLIQSLRAVADKAEEVERTVVVETHLLTIMDSPETNAQVLEAVGSQRMTVVMDYVNHFQTLHQVYDSAPRLDHIFDIMGPISSVGHCKDLMPSDGLVLHLDEAIPGEGELDMALALKRWEELYPEGYMLLEHLPNEKYPRASANTHDIAAAAGIDIH